MPSDHSDDIFSFANVLDDSSPSPIGELPDISQVPEFDDFETTNQPNFSFFEREEPKALSVEPQSSPLEGAPFQEQLITHENRAESQNFSLGEAASPQKKGEFSNDIKMTGNNDSFRAEGSLKKDEQKDLVRQQLHEADADTDAEICREKAITMAADVQMHQIETVKEDVCKQRHVSSESEVDPDAAEVNAKTSDHVDSQGIQDSRRHVPNTCSPSHTNPTTIALGSITTKPKTDVSRHLDTPSHIPNTLPETQLNEQSNQNLAAYPKVFPSQPQFNSTTQCEAPKNAIPPTSPLGRLPQGMRDMLLAHARKQSYATAELRAVQIAQKAAQAIHRMAQNGTLQAKAAPNQTSNNSQVNLSTHAFETIDPPSRTALKRVRSTASSKSHTAGDPNLTVQHPGVSSDQNLRQASRAKNVSPLNIFCNSDRVDVTKMSSEEVPLSRVSSADFQCNKLRGSQHALAAIPMTSIPGTSHTTGKVMENRFQGVNNCPTTLSDPKNPIPFTTPIRPTSMAQSNSLQAWTPLPVQIAPGAALGALKVIERNHSPAEGAAEGISTTQAQVAAMTSGSWEQKAASSSGSLVTPSSAADYPEDSATTSGAQGRRPISQTHDGPRLRFSKNAAASNYCHICGRSSKTVAVFDCANLTIGLCRKVLCEKCLIIHEPEMVQWARQRGTGWLCMHCRNRCPKKARCTQYTRNNKKRREKNDEKKRLKRLKLQHDEGKAEPEPKHLNDVDDGAGNSPTGITENVF